jgi:hypothetical protein
MSETRVIWKYELSAYGETIIRVPKFYGIAHAVEQHGKLCVWIEVDPNAQGFEELKFDVRLTGQRYHVSDSDYHVGTVLLQGGAYVVHVFLVWPLESLRRGF